MTTWVNSQNGNFSGGSFYWARGNRCFVRLWPDPVVLCETGPECWDEIEDIRDDFNLTELHRFETEAIERYSLKHPELVAAIRATPELMKEADLPVELWSLLQTQKLIRKREGFLGTIPSPVLNTIRMYGDEHYTLLKFISKHPRAIELMEANPFLGYMVATQARWRPKNERGVEFDLDGVKNRRRRDILVSLGFSCASEGLARIVGKVTSAACKKYIIRGFRNAVRNPETVRRLGFLSRINGEVMRIAIHSSLMSLTTNAFLEEIAEAPDEKCDGRYVKTLKICRRILGNEKKPVVPRIFPSMAQARAFCGKHAMSLSSDEIQRIGVVIPPPPIPESENVRALQSPEAIAEEGEEQCNCVWTLVPAIAAGRIYLYRVLGPQRATVAVVHRNKGWELGEIEGTDYTPVGQETLNRSSQSLSRVYHS